MKPRDAFGVIVRAAGLGFVLAGVLDLTYLAIEALGLPVASRYPTGVTLTAGVFYVVIGLALLIGAPLIVRLIYGRDRPN